MIEQLKTNVPVFNEEMIEISVEDLFEEMSSNLPLSSIEKIFLKYLNTCPHGSQRVVGYKRMFINKIIYNFYICEFLYTLKSIPTSTCTNRINIIREMIQEEEQFFKKNQYYLKQFPLYKEMRAIHTWMKDYILKSVIPRVEQYIQQTLDVGVLNEY